jgi:hypothetical protein
LTLTLHRLCALARLAAFWLLALAWGQAALAASPLDGGMTHLAIEYKVAPANRPALYQHMQSEGLDQLDRWKREGRLKDFKVLFGRYADAPVWDMLLLISFADVAQAGRWKEVERTHPGGLSPKALALVTSVESNPVDQWFEGGTSQANGVYLVIPYDYLVATDKYVSYLEGYLLPQLKGWLANGALSHYNMFIGRYAVARHWSALLVLEYNGEDGMAARERVTREVRATLAGKDPVWTEWSKDKSNIRTTRQYMLADELRKP